ncbi:MAG: N-acetylmuramidase family protein [Muribaculaceae bacterium]
MTNLHKSALAAITALAAIAVSAIPAEQITPPPPTDTLGIAHIGLNKDGREYIVVGNDTVHLTFAQEDRKGPLTERDFVEVAAELGVEVPAIKAVVEIEAGPGHKGFFKTNMPIINFDLTMYRQFAARNKLNLAKYTKSHAVIFARPNIAKYGSQQAAQYARLNAAMSIDSLTAIQGTFWGMFQIGGFNWRQCGTSSPQEFLRLMSRSERDQLELFAEFITRTGMLRYLKAKNWTAFARNYNGPGYAARGYHTKLARAYAKHNKK